MRTFWLVTSPRITETAIHLTDQGGHWLMHSTHTTMKVSCSSGGCVSMRVTVRCKGLFWVCNLECEDVIILQFFFVVVVCFGGEGRFRCRVDKKGNPGFYLNQSSIYGELSRITIVCCHASRKVFANVILQN